MPEYTSTALEDRHEIGTSGALDSRTLTPDARDYLCGLVKVCRMFAEGLARLGLTEVQINDVMAEQMFRISRQTRVDPLLFTNPGTQVGAFGDGRWNTYSSDNARSLHASQLPEIAKFLEGESPVTDTIVAAPVVETKPAPNPEPRVSAVASVLADYVRSKSKETKAEPAPAVVAPPVTIPVETIAIEPVAEPESTSYYGRQFANVSGKRVTYTVAKDDGAVVTLEHPVTFAHRHVTHADLTNPRKYKPA